MKFAGKLFKFSKVSVMDIKRKRFDVLSSFDLHRVPTFDSSDRAFKDNLFDFQGLALFQQSVVVALALWKDENYSRHHR